jgi:stearoyl-CoA desaturase (Delta-9 desaturase)
MSVGRQQAPFGVIFGGPEVVSKTIEYIVIVGSLVIGSIAAIVWALYHPITWIEITALLMGYVIINIGVGLALHRHFSHESFKTYPAVRYVLGAFGAMSCQGSMLKWAADHRRHHAHTDSCGDIHSPHIDATRTAATPIRGGACCMVTSPGCSTTPPPT